MKVILTAEVQGKGGEGDVINVARGFANNYLIPRGLAILATPGNLKQLEQRKNSIAKREEKRFADAANLKEKLFGSVTSVMIAEAASAQFGVEIDKRRVELKSPIKTAGEFEVAISLYRSTKATLKVLVGSEKPAAVEEAVVEPVVEETPAA